MRSTASLEPTIEYIKGLVPLRYPVLFVDRVLAWTLGEKITALKAFTANEPFFGTECPDALRPPEAMMIESMVQVAGLTLPKRPHLYVYLRGLDNVTIHQRVQYGDVMVTHAEKIRERGPMFQVRAESKVDDVTVISGEITYVYLEGTDEPEL